MGIVQHRTLSSTPNIFNRSKRRCCEQCSSGPYSDKLHYFTCIPYSFILNHNFFFQIHIGAILTLVFQSYFLWKARLKYLYVAPRREEVSQAVLWHLCWHCSDAPARNNRTTHANRIYLNIYPLKLYHETLLPHSLHAYYHVQYRRNIPENDFLFYSKIKNEKFHAIY